MNAIKFIHILCTCVFHFHQIFAIFCSTEALHYLSAIVCFVLNILIVIICISFHNQLKCHHIMFCRCTNVLMLCLITIKLFLTLYVPHVITLYCDIETCNLILIL